LTNCFVFLLFETLGRETVPFPRMEASPNETQLEGKPLPEDDVSHLLELAEGLLVLGQDVVGVGAADALAKISKIIKKFNFN
jgi:hypothetical protein